MANYKIVVSASAEKSLNRVPKRDLAKIISLIQTLAIEPRPNGCRKFAGEKSVYRVRQGRYRIIYEIKDKILHVFVLKIGHRKDVYR